MYLLYEIKALDEQPRLDNDEEMGTETEDELNIDKDSSGASSSSSSSASSPRNNKRRVSVIENNKEEVKDEEEKEYVDIFTDILGLIVLNKK